MREIPAYARFTLIGLSIALIILAMVTARELLLPLSWALLLALLILPLQKRLEKLTGSRALSAILSVVILAGIVGGTIYLLSLQVIKLINDLPALFKKISTQLQDLRLFAEQTLGIPYNEQPSQLIDGLRNLLQDSPGSLGEFLFGTVKTLILIGILPIYIFFILYYRDRIRLFFNMLYRPGKREAVMHTIWKAGNVVQKYLGGMVMVTVIVAIMVLIVFLAMGIKHALFFAVFVAVFNLIPYIGVLIASTISILYVFITKDSLLYPVLTLAFLWGIQLIENNLITPFVVGRQIRLNPLAVILVIILGGMIWGVSGMIIFIPLLGGIKVIFDDIPALRPYGFLLGDDPP